MPVTAPSITGTPQGFSFTATGTVVTYTGGGTTGATTFDIICVNSDNTVATPSGWTLGPSRIVNQGTYIFYRAGGVTTATIDLGGGISTSTDVLWVRITNSAGIDSGATAVTGVDGSPATTSFPLTSGALAASTSLALMFAALHNFSSAPSSPSWSSGYTEQAEATIGTGGAGTYGNVAVKVPAGTAAESPSVSYTNAATNRYSLFVSFLGFDNGGVTGVTPTGGSLSIVAGNPSSTAVITTTPGGAHLTIAAGSLRVGTQVRAAGAGWAQYGAIVRFDIEEWKRAQQLPPTRCPNHCEPLKQGPRGELYCPFGFEVFDSAGQRLYGREQHLGDDDPTWR